MISQPLEVDEKIVPIRRWTWRTTTVTSEHCIVPFFYWTKDHQRLRIVPFHIQRQWHRTISELWRYRNYTDDNVATLTNNERRLLSSWIGANTYNTMPLWETFLRHFPTSCPEGQFDYRTIRFRILQKKKQRIDIPSVTTLFIFEIWSICTLESSIFVWMVTDGKTPITSSLICIFSRRSNICVDTERKAELSFDYMSFRYLWLGVFTSA